MGFLDKIKKQLSGAKEEEAKKVEEQTVKPQAEEVKKEEPVKSEDNFWSSLFADKKEDVVKEDEALLAKQAAEKEAREKAAIEAKRLEDEKTLAAKKQAESLAEAKQEAEKERLAKIEADKLTEANALKAKEAEAEKLKLEAQAKAEKEKAEQLRLEQERIAKEKAEAAAKAKIEREKAEQEKAVLAEKQRLENERIAAEKLAKEKAEKEAAEQKAKAESEKNTGFWGNFFGRGNKSTEAELQKDLDDGIKQTKQGFFEKITKAVAGKTEVDEDLLDEIENALVSSDVGVETTVKIIDRLEEKVASDKYFSSKELYRLVKGVIIELLSENKTPNLTEYEFPDKGKYPYVVLVVGVNGVGKTTTIAKLAAKAKSQGKKVMLGAGDTFRAAAVKQIEVWGERVGVPVISHGMDTDPAAVAYDTVKAAMEQNADVVFIDTAGRLHNKVGLMNELSKIKRVMQKIVPDVPHDVLLVLDASTGQNALEQAKHFTEATQVTCLAVTKLDGTAKGGVIIGIADQFSIPIRYVGVGEQVHHLQLFNKEKFVDTLFGEE